MSDLEKKVRGVLSRVFRDLPVFGGPPGWEIEARFLDEATPEIVSLFRGDRTEDEPSDDRLLQEAAAAFTGGGANVKNLGPGVLESMVVRMGHKPRDAAGWFSAGYAAGARREGRIFEESEGNEG